MTDSANRVVDRCVSTNDLARELGERGYPHGTWVSARVQESGRGRLGRVWQGIEGNLFLSIVSRVEPPKLWSWVPLASAVGIAGALRSRFPALDLRIKWPNDLWIRGAKAGGILCEGIGGSQGSFIVIGIGLNCVAAPDRGSVDQDVTSLSEALALPLAADDIREDVLQGVLQALGGLMTRGENTIRERYAAWPALAPGTRIEWGSGHQGQVIGLGPSGELRVALESGLEESLYAEDVKVRIKS